MYKAIIELRVCICSLKSALDLIEFVHQSVPWSRNVGPFEYRWQEEAETRFFANYRLTRNPVKPVANEPVDVLRVASYRFLFSRISNLVSRPR